MIQIKTENTARKLYPQIIDELKHGIIVFCMSAICHTVKTFLLTLADTWFFIINATEIIWYFYDSESYRFSKLPTKKFVGCFFLKLMAGERRWDKRRNVFNNYLIFVNEITTITIKVMVVISINNFKQGPTQKALINIEYHLFCICQPLKKEKLKIFH